MIAEITRTGIHSDHVDHHYMTLGNRSTQKFKYDGRTITIEGNKPGYGFFLVDNKKHFVKAVINDGYMLATTISGEKVTITAK